MRRIMQFQSMAKQVLWTPRTVRERRLLICCSALLTVTLVWRLLWLPAYQDSVALARQVPQLQQQLAAMQEQARTAAGLASRRHGPALHGASLQRALQDALARQDWMGAGATLQGDSVQLSVPRASFSAWTAWLLEVQRSSLVQVDRVHITALKPLGQVAVTAVLSSRP